MKPITAILLAAGESKRMGEANKLLLPYRGAPLIHRVAEAIAQSKAAEQIVVTGHEAAAIEGALRAYGMRFVYNADYETGMTSSIQAGVQAAHSAAEGFMICLSDLPDLNAGILDRVMDQFAIAISQDPQVIIIPSHQGRRGHPIIFSRYYKEALLHHPHPEGCKAIIQDHSSHVVLVEISEEGILKDIDRPEDYRGLIEE